MTTVEKKTQNALPFPEKITEYDQYLFAQATNYDIYNKLGSHVTVNNGEKGVYFAVWAPKAKAVSLVGNFNSWDGSKNPMTRNEPNGIWDIFVPGLDVGEVYKYQIKTWDDRILMKADPYANSNELRPNNASVVSDISHFKWSDAKWITNRRKTDIKKAPMAIYEVHIGSWRRHKEVGENGTDFYNYREFAHEITDYVKQMGYTHIELMGIAEHPFDGSWGYQVTGYYAPTSRYGTPEDFMYMINYLHEHKIGVILDWVPAHFPRDGHGLAKFDEYYEKGWMDRVITTNLNYRVPELLTRPYYVEANMSKYLASIIDIINHDVSVEKVRSSNEKIMSLMEKVNSR